MISLRRREWMLGGMVAACAEAWPAGAALAQEASATPKTLADDMRILREVLTTLHPGLYRYNSPMAMSAGMDALERAFLDAPDLATRYLALSRFLASIRCGHSYANFYNQSSAMRTALFDRKTRLPFAFRFIDDAMIVTADHGSGADVRPGTEILSVNGLSAAGLLAQLLPYVRADGHNDAKRRALLSVTGDDRYETFDVFHGLVFGAPANAQHEVVMRTPDGVVRTLQVPAITLAQRQSFRAAAAPASDHPLWQWTMRDDGIAVLTMDSWGTYDSKWDWRTWLTERLDTLNGARGLIVDIRANEGGEDCGDALIARFAQNDILLAEENRLVRYRTTPATLDPYLDTWDEGFRTLGVDAEPFDAQFFRLKRGDTDRVIAARGPRIDVPMTVLIGPQNSSATYQFAAHCKRARLATLIGEPTGGNQRGINGGCFFFVRLPASGLEFDLPLIGSFPSGAVPDAGITPDVVVRQSARDIADDRDVVMDAASAGLTKA